MAERSYTDIVNPSTKVPSSSDQSALNNLGQALGAGVNFKDSARGNPFFVPLKPPTNPNASTVDSHPWKVPFPCRLVIADMNVRNENGAAATGDILVNRASAGYVSQLDAAEALTADTPVRVAPETTGISVSLQKDDLVIFRVIGAGAGEIIGAEALFLCVEL